MNENYPTEEPKGETKSEPAMNSPFVGTEKKPEPKVEPAKSVEVKTEAAPKDEPIVHGEGAQRFANKNATHSERVLHGNVVTPPVRKERYEHPERNA